MPVVDAVLLICAAQLPEWPPETLVNTTPAPEPDVFHPEVSVSKPVFVTRLMVSEAVFVFPALLPVTVCGPPDVAVQVLPLQDPFGAIEKVVLEVTSPSELLAASKPWAVYACDPPATMVALEGLMEMWSRAPPPTCNEAVPVLPPLLPVTVCAPEAVAVQVARVQDPFGPIENVVLAVTSPSELLNWSRASAVYACEPPDVIVAEAGARARWSSGPAVTVSDAVLVLPASFPVTRCVPADVAVQLPPVQDPFGPIEKVVLDVTSPSELFEASKPSAVYACEPPAAIDALEGLITM